MAIYAGQSLKATAVFKLENGLLAYPSTTTFETRSPNGVATTYTAGVDPEVEDVSVGTYALHFVGDRGGRWIVKAVGIMSNANADQVVSVAYIDVIDAF